MAWTKEQEAAIKGRNSNMLVSAAAGSGKTSVLVERIIQRVLDKDNPVDIDKIIVVTFTKAAAEEMKGRMVKAFEKRLEDNPEDSNLCRQIALTDHAKITTIDSFCSYILRNYYNSIEFDPNFRIADNGEMALIKSDVYAELLEEKLSMGDEAFIQAIESFTPGKDLSAFNKIIDGLQNFSESHPWPIDWLVSCRNLYNINNIEQFNECELVKYTIDYIKTLCKESIATYKYLIEICNENMEFEPYIETFTSDIELLKRCLSANDFLKMSDYIAADFVRIKAIRNCSDDETKTFMQNIRKSIKERISNIKKTFFSKPVEVIIESIAQCRNNMEIIIDFTIEYSERLRKAKEEKNIVTFSDVEHRALDILIDRKDGNEEYTRVADELASIYEEIYIDEYQDSNYVQEKILTAVSKCRFGKPNIFMVGDVKQSIYKFRMAKPELFIEKYMTYSEEENNSYRKIELHNNFRSTKNVINTVNDIFYKIMHSSIGGIDYTDKAALYHGGNIDDKIDTTTDFTVMSPEAIKDWGIDKEEAYARLAAYKIKELKNNHPELTYKDFVILLRSDKKTGLYYADALNNCGIPAVYSSTTGYFSSYEIRTVTDFLCIIDNPRQELPLVSVMRSYFAYFTVEELALIKGRRKKADFYDCLCIYSEKEGELSEKCRTFLALLEAFREKSRQVTVKELVSDIIFSTGYYDYVKFLPGGSSRKLNLDMLIVRAKEYEKTSYSGLFNFIRYINKLKKYEVDYGLSKGVDSDNNVVRIMSIHQSKGLEFPVVILGDASKGYNLRDLNEAVVIDSNFGIGFDNINLKTRTKSAFVFKEMIKKRMESDDIGEELRILYVALTRAVQKLVILSIPSKKEYEKLSQSIARDEINMEFIIGNKNYAALISEAIRGNNCSGKYNIEDISLTKLIENEKYVLAEGLDKAAFITDEFGITKEVSKELMDEVKTVLEYDYPYESINGLRSKYAVSDIKHMASEENEDEADRLIKPESIRKIPLFIEAEEEENAGAKRGTAYHKYFEIMDYESCKDYESINEHFMECINNKLMPEEYEGLINRNYFVTFINSALGQRMKKAALNGDLYREQPFIMEIGANEVRAEYPSGEKVLIQGIVDAFFFEEDKVYIVDYKTDRVDNAETLINKYKKQLELYAITLEAVTGKKIGGCYLYSTALGKEILL